MTGADLRRLAAGALTIRERWREASTRNLDGPDDPLAAERLRRWREEVAPGDEAAFLRRLAWDGVGEAEVAAAVGSAEWPAGRPLPSWTLLLAELVEAASRAVPAAPSWRGKGVLTPDPGPANRETPAFVPFAIPFEELLAPMAGVVVGRLGKRAGRLWDLLADPVKASLEDQVLGLLSGACAGALYPWFAHLRAVRLPVTLTHPMTEKLASQRTVYLDFVRRMRDGGLADLFRRFAALARLVGTLVELWVEATHELLSRLDADTVRLERRFAGSTPTGPVVRIDSRLSDPHNGRRSARAVTFASGLRLVYKPRTMALEATLCGLLDWMSGHGLTGGPRSYAVLQRAGYGWAEFVEHTPCPHREAARCFYHRSGMLLCLVYALDGTDCHAENLVAAGEHPVLVDAETLFYPTLVGARSWGSVLTTGLLPGWESIGDDEELDLGGLTGDDPSPVDTTGFDHPNTDAMRPCGPPGRGRPSLNRPYLAPHPEQPFSAVDFVEPLVSGFRQMYGFLMDHRAEILDPATGALPDLADGLPVRFIVRSTSVYGRILGRSVGLEHLGNGVDRSIALECLARAFVSTASRPPLWPVVEAEQAALLQADIPLFSTNTSWDALAVSPDRRLPGVFARSSSETFGSHLRRLDSDDLECQVRLIRAAFEVSGAVIPHGRPAGIPSGRPPGDGHDTSSGDAELVHEAVRLAERLRSEAFTTRDGISWVGFHATLGRHYEAEPMGDGLYDGLSGVLLFLAALGPVAGDEYRDLAKAVADRIHRELPAPGEPTGIGVSNGAGGIVFALAHASRLLGESSVLEDAHRAADSITEEAVAADRELDVMQGAAGAILGLLALGRASGRPEARSQAVSCGDHLLRSSVSVGEGMRAWPTLGRRLLTGFSHGASGIAYALARLHEASGEDRFARAAVEALAYEHSMLSPERGNWPDLRFHTDSGPSYGESWCHGAPGTGLALLGARRSLPGVDVDNDLEIALRTTARLDPGEVDHLCCGTLGRMEILLVAGRELGRPELSEAARDGMARVVGSARRADGYALFTGLPRRVLSFGLFQGLTGIGYQLLRAAIGDTLPSVLLFEA